MTTTITRWSGELTERLMQAVYDGRLELRELAQAERLSLSALAEWANEPATRRALDGLCRLNDARSAMLVSRYRPIAAGKLLELAGEGAGGEVARKACVDLLKVSLIAAEPAVAARDEDEAAVEPALHDLLAALSRSTSPDGDEDDAESESDR